jgi:molybdate transport system substrate-binding protein
MTTVVLSTLALKGVLEALQPAGYQLRFDSTQALLARMSGGERADLLILTAEAMRELQAAGHVSQVSALGSSGVSVAVRKGAPRPDIGSQAALIEALEAAQSVAHSRSGASGIYFSALLAKLGVRLKKRVIVEQGPVGLAVARGEAELGAQMTCELAPVAGIDIIGPLPAPLQVLTRFSAGVSSDATDAKGALALIDLLRSDAAHRAMLANGMQPAGM